MSVGNGRKRGTWVTKALRQPGTKAPKRSRNQAHRQKIAPIRTSVFKAGDLVG